MLSRTLSNKSDRVRRSKSASSVRSKQPTSLTQDHVESEISRQHAITAANVALERAHERASAEVRRSTDLARINSITSKSNSTATPRSQAIRFNSAAELRRQRSILRQRAPSVASSIQPPEDDAPPPFTAIPPLSEFGVPPGYGSTPSSYRRLRKAKSMFNPGRRPLSIHSITPRRGGSPYTLRSVHHTLGGANASLKLGLRRSLSFIKGGSRSVSKAGPLGGNNDAAIQLARDQFEFELRQQQVKEDHSIFRRAKRGQNAFRKTVRSSKKTEYGNPIASDNQIIPDSTPPSSKTRAFSMSIRQTVKRMFGRSSSGKNDVPVQQLDASRQHFRDYFDSSVADISTEYLHSYPEISTSRGSIYLPSLNDYGSVEDFHNVTSTRHTNNSSESITNTQSRISSWTDSTTSAATHLPMEKKRLSIIQEHGGPHQPSSSAGRHIDSISIFRKPLRTQTNSAQHSPIIDSRRVYSALMKRIEESEREESNAKAQFAAGGNGFNTESFSSPAGAISQAAPTIRPVPSDSSLKSFSNRQSSQTTNGSYELGYSGDESNPTPSRNQACLASYQRKNQKSRDGRPAFFPFSSEDKPETTSPFKKVLISRHESSSSPEDASVIRHHLSPDGSTPNSDSVYSRTTSGNTVGREPSLSPQESQPPGMATILTHASGRYARPISPMVKMHEIKSDSSAEWRSWMSSQIASIDRRNSRKRQGSNSVKSDQTHFRENAQIDEDDTTIGRVGPSPTVQRRPSTSSTRFPLLDIKQVPRNLVPEPRRSSSCNNKVHQDPQRASTCNNENVKVLEQGGVHLVKSTLTLKPSQLSLASFRRDLRNTTPPEVKRKKSIFTLIGGDLTPKPQNYISSSGDGNKSSGSDKSSPTVIQHVARLSRPFDINHAPYGRPLTMVPDLQFAEAKTNKAEMESLGMRLGTSSRRMVSGFLRSRRRGVGTNKSGDEVEPSKVLDHGLENENDMAFL